MPQYFIKSENISGIRCRIVGDDFIHLARVRRVRESDIVHVRVESGGLFSARVVQVNDSAIEAEIIGPDESADIFLDLTLCMSVMKGRKNDQAIRDAVEVGVNRIVPLISGRTIPDMSGKEKEKVLRWNRIARDAAKQSMRDHVPVVDNICSFSEALVKRPEDTRIIAHPAAFPDLKTVLGAAVNTKAVSLMVGPEGGFDSEEIIRAEECGWKAVHFGFTQMRAETAAVVLPALVIYALSPGHPG